MIRSLCHPQQAKHRYIPDGTGFWDGPDIVLMSERTWVRHWRRAGAGTGCYWSPPTRLEKLGEVSAAALDSDSHKDDNKIYWRNQPDRVMLKNFYNVSVVREGFKKSMEFSISGGGVFTPFHTCFIFDYSNCGKNVFIVFLKPSLNSSN